MFIFHLIYLFHNVNSLTTIKPETLHNFHISEHDGGKDWYTQMSVHKMKEGLDSCATRSTAFHYIDSDLMKRMHALLHGFCVDSFVNERVLIPLGLNV